MPYIKSKGPPSETRCRQEQILFVHLLRFTLYECIFLITELKKNLHILILLSMRQSQCNYYLTLIACNHVILNNSVCLHVYNVITTGNDLES